MGCSKFRKSHWAHLHIMLNRDYFLNKVFPHRSQCSVQWWRAGIALRHHHHCKISRRRRLSTMSVLVNFCLVFNYKTGQKILKTYTVHWSRGTNRACLGWMTQKSLITIYSQDTHPRSTTTRWRENCLTALIFKSLINLNHA